MWFLLAMYIPHPERAICPALFQLGLVGLLACALYAYGRSRYGHRAMVKSLLIGEMISFFPVVVQMFVGLGDYGDSCRGFGDYNYPDWFLVLVSHFELSGFAISSFICLLVSTLILSIIKAGKPRRDQRSRAESSTQCSDPRDLED